MSSYAHSTRLGNMNVFLWFTLVLTSFGLIGYTNGYVYAQTLQKDAVQLVEYQTYANVRMFTFQIPEATVMAEWSFHLLSNDSFDCLPQNATVNYQLGGFPLINPKGEKFPDKFFKDRSYAKQIAMNNVYDHFVISNVQSPRAGTWFVSAYLQHDGDESLRPDIFTKKKCNFYLKPSLLLFTEQQDDVISLSNSYMQSVVIDSSVVVRFFVPKHAYSYSLQALSCKTLVGEKCQFNITSQETLWPRMEAPIFTSVFKSSYQRNLRTFYCDFDEVNTDCSVNVTSPDTGSWHYARLWTVETSLKINIAVTIKECVISTNASGCQAFPLESISNPMVAYQVSYFNRNPIIGISDVTPYVSSLETRVMSDSGGTLMYRIFATNVTNVQATIYNCVNHQHLKHDMNDIRNCSETKGLTLPWKENSSSLLYVPYPEAGVWYISTIAECYTETNGSRKVILCPETLSIYMFASIRPCVNRGCNGKYGSCYGYYSGVTHWSVCKCKVGWRGYGCTDGTYAIPDNIQLLQTLLLTLSNLMILVASIVALYRKWFPEALVLFFAAFASSWYHACDNGTIYAYCPVDYNMLQYCDFYGSLYSFWMAIMALANLPVKLRAFFHVAGSLGIIIGTQYTLTGTWNFIVIISLAAIILIVSWVKVCKRTKRLYPKIRVYITAILPGALCLGVGIALYAGFETESNYPYVHSAWHCIIALAVIVCLPKYETIDCSPCLKHCKRRPAWAAIPKEQAAASDSSLLSMEESANQQSANSSSS